jgi:hypothetical protein
MRRARNNVIAAGLVTGLGAVACLIVGSSSPVARGSVRPLQREEPFGYTAAFNAELGAIGQITPRQFAERYPTPDYLPRFGWDPTTARFWDEFDKDPAAIAAGGTKRHGRYDFRLRPDELATFKRNGFVVSERMGAASFAEMFYRIWGRDLPVFVTSDAVLHAWHRSYDAMLEELETTYLSASLAELLAGMADGVPAARAEYGGGPLGEGLGDADYFLGVARSLLAGHPVPTRLGQDGRVSDTLRAVAGERMQEFVLFGRERLMDFSQFKPRGHYEKSDLLKWYFKAMTWCGRIDLRVAGGHDATGTLSDPRELGAAVVLHDLLRRSGRFEQWRQFDALVQTFVGRTDSATFAHLDALLSAARIDTPAKITDEAALAALQADVLAGKFGLQDIRGDIYVSPLGSKEPIQMPRSFTLLGQRFALDSWVLAKLVYDDIRWDGGKVQRRVPSGLDVAFAAFGNDHAVPDLADRMENGPRKFRDRLNYQHNLAAVRNVIDRQTPAAWDETMYTCWLSALRELSRPTTDPMYPEAMRTRAWAMKELNTQLGSWAQLRHDTILYVKQSYTATTLCEYPAGFVEPVPEFWGRMEAMAHRGSDLLRNTPFPEAHRHLQDRQWRFLRSFGAKVGVLKGMAAKHLARQELSPDERKVLEDFIQWGSGGSGMPPTYTGWYPGLFYGGRMDSGKWDALVADVHTDVPDYTVGDPGCVLHQGVGNVDLLLIAVDSGADRAVYAGPVLSHYEFELPGVGRVTDSEWRKRVNAGDLPPRPEWTRSYLVPGTNPDAHRYKAE